MNIKETESILELLRAEYPHSFEKLTSEEKVTKVTTWTSMFFKDSVTDVLNAIKQFMDNDTKGYAPTYGQIKQYLRRVALFEADDMTMALRQNRAVYKAVTGHDYEPADCVKDKLGFPKCVRCNEQTKCRPISERGILIN